MESVNTLSFAALGAYWGAAELNYSLAVFIVILVHLKISARAESYIRSACRQPSFGAKEERFAASQSHFAYRLVFLGGYRIRSVPKIKDFDRAAKTVGVSIPPHP